MKTLLICPAERESVATLAESAPLSNLPVFGKSLINHWLTRLASLGAKEILILASDRPEKVRALVGNGARWGVRAEIFPEIRELTPAEARAKYRADGDVVTMDHLPGAPEFPLFTNHADFFKALQNWLPRAATTPDRIGVHEIQPGVWAGLRTRVAPDAELRAPCWIGENVFIGAGAIVGPNAVLENKTFVARGTEISHSVIGEETFIGEFTEIHNSITCGGTLLNWQLASAVKVPDDFLLCSLAKREPAFKSINVFSRLAALLTALLTLPFVLLPMLKSKFRGTAVFRPRIAVRPRGSGIVGIPGDALIYHELTNARGWLRRWPQLWSVARGDFAWIGNRPLSPNQVARLSNEFERLWLGAPIGLISLADGEGCASFFNVETRAHASFYSTQASRRLDWNVFARAIFFLMTGAPYSRMRERLAGIFEPARVEIRKAH